MNSYIARLPLIKSIIIIIIIITTISTNIGVPKSTIERVLRMNQYHHFSLSGYKHFGSLTNIYAGIVLQAHVKKIQQRC